MSTILMIDAVLERISSILGSEELPGKDEVRRSPKIVAGWLSAKQRGDDDANEFPFILVRPSGGQRSPAQGAQQGQNSASLVVRVGTYGADNQGWREAVQMAERIAIDFERHPVLDDRYEIDGSMSWKLDDDQPYPQWIASLQINVTMPMPSRQPESDVYGSGY